ncbi:hypothetical protein PVAND_008825 [Polypedilum vanderplanki]|uniref:Chitin-binding type-2 domain-containing protein n=1 Tax=Polypedilum vanderplanki TaxID=319348 RepID=A0A9J6CBF9_POLVA|nr:hypothetical protein PVAND_008825 [Polypedilum vanderplanki]
MLLKSLTFIFAFVSLIYCQKFDSRCVIPQTRPSQNLPHESSCEFFYKCFHGNLLLLSCPRDTHFDTFSSACIPKDVSNCVFSNPTPPTIATTQFISTSTTEMQISTDLFTTPTAPIRTTTISLPSPDKIPMPSSIFTIPTAPTKTATKFFRPTPPNS